jgi:hypothetical protein
MMVAIMVGGTAYLLFGRCLAVGEDPVKVYEDKVRRELMRENDYKLRN